MTSLDMGRLDEIERRIDARMAEISRRVDDATGDGKAAALCAPRPSFAPMPCLERGRRDVGPISVSIGPEDLALVAKINFALIALRPGDELRPYGKSEFFERLLQDIARKAGERGLTLGYSDIRVVQEGRVTHTGYGTFCGHRPAFVGIPQDPFDGGEVLLRRAAEVAAYYVKRWDFRNLEDVSVAWQWMNARFDRFSGKDTFVFQFIEPNNAMYRPLNPAFTSSQLVFDAKNCTRECVGHEYTHGVSQNRRRWAMYRFVTGAVNESFSDIFAKFATWAYEGLDMTNPNRWIYSGCRDMAHPENIPQNGWTVASYYRQKPSPDNPKSGWYVGHADNGGVHRNNGVLARLCFLLCEGESFVRDDGRSFDVKPIGFRRAEELFGTLLFGSYLNSRIDTLYEVCLGMAKAAQDLGFTEDEWKSLEAACDAVAIIPPESYAGIRRVNREYRMMKAHRKWWGGRASLKDNLAETFRRELSMDVPGAGFEVEDCPAGDAGDERGASAGERHVMLRQTFNGLPVFGATAIVHMRGEGDVTYFNSGFSRSVARVSGTDRIGRDKACAAATAGNEFLSAMEAEKVVWDPAAAGEAGDPLVAWRVVTASGGMPEDQVIVDAETGRVLFTSPMRTS